MALLPGDGTLREGTLREKATIQWDVLSWLVVLLVWSKQSDFFPDLVLPLPTTDLLASVVSFNTSE